MSEQANLSFASRTAPAEGVVVVFAEEGRKLSQSAEDLDKRSKGLLSKAADITGFKGKKEQVVDLLARLVEQSLVLATDVGNDQRYRLLETIRQYAAERLGETRDVDTTRRRHATYYRALAAKTVDVGLRLAGMPEE